MPVKIRLQRKGRKQRPFYHIVIADVRAPRDGKYIQRIGSYNPLTVPATIDLDRDAAYEWLLKGAQPTETVRSILRFKGVLYKKHLLRGVAKGSLTVEQAEEKLQAWIDGKEEKNVERRAAVVASKIAEHAKRSGTPPPPPSQTIEEATKAVDAAAASDEGKTLAEIAEAKDPVELDVKETTEEVVAEATEKVEEVAEKAEDTTKTEE